MKKALAFLLIAFILLVPKSAQAQSEEKITQFLTDIRISRDNIAKVTERITYDFGSNERHGIFRFIPIETRAEDSNQRFYYNFDWQSILQDGQAASVTFSESSSYVEAKIGDPNETISGKVTYTISYEMGPIAAQDIDGDFINLNITGNNWDVPMEKVFATVTYDNDVKILETICYTGISGSTDRNCKDQRNNNVTAVEARFLNAYEGVTLNDLVTEGSFDVYAVAEDPPPPDFRPAINVALGGSAILIGIFLRFISWLQYRYRRKNQTIVAQYEPPKKLSAGSIGLLYDNKSNFTEITATLIDLAVKGYIKIQLTRKKSWLRPAQYTIHKLKTSKGLKVHEKALFTLLFDGTNGKIHLRNIDKHDAGKTIKDIYKNLKQNLEDFGFTHKQKKANFRSNANLLFFLLISAQIVLGGYFLYSGVDGGNYAPLLVTSGISLFLILIGFAISKRTELSPSGYKTWGKIEGLKLYLSVAEKDRLEFHNAPDKTPEHFSTMLPYAIALGVDKQWASQFKELDVAEKLDWYSGDGTFTALALTNSLRSDFTKAVSSNMTPPSQSSSGFGGGFSGGGVGGGGGGSW